MKELCLFFKFRIKEIRRFPHFPSTCSDIMFILHMTLMYYRSSSSVAVLYLSGCPSVRPFSSLFSYMHWQIELNFSIWLWFLQCVTLSQILYKISLFYCSWRACYAPYAVLWYCFNTMIVRFIHITFFLYAALFLPTFVLCNVHFFVYVCCHLCFVRFFVYKYHVIM